MLYKMDKKCLKVDIDSVIEDLKSNIKFKSKKQTQTKNMFQMMFANRNDVAEENKKEADEQMQELVNELRWRKETLEKDEFILCCVINFKHQFLSNGRSEKNQRTEYSTDKMG